MHPDTEKKPLCRWRTSLLLLVGIFLAGMAATFFISFRKGGGVTDAQYYQNGLNYDRTPSGARNPGLNWSLSASLAGRDLLVRVHDEKGGAVPGGRLLLCPLGKNEAARPPLLLRECAPGEYRAAWPAAKGELHGILRFTKGEASASQRVVFF